MPSNEVIFRLEKSKHRRGDEVSQKVEEERDLAAFDCYSLYRHCDKSYEWRLCKIMQKELIVPNANNPFEMLSPQQLLA